MLHFIWLEKEKFNKHSGVKAFFFREIIKEGLLDKKYGKLYNKLYYLREEADYTPNPSFEKSEVETIIKETEDFLDKMRIIIEKKIKTISNE